MKFIEKLREKHAFKPIDNTYTYQYTLGPLPLPQPWRQTHPDAYLLPLPFITNFAEYGRIQLLRARERDYLNDLAADIYVNGISTPLEFVFDSSGKLRLQEGYHRLSIALESPESFPRLPVTVRRVSSTIRSYGRSVAEDLDFILDTIGKL